MHLEQARSNFLQKEREKEEERRHQAEESVRRFGGEGAQGEGKEYLGHTVPGEVAMAEVHLLSQRVGPALTLSELESQGLTPQWCQCCGAQVHRRKLSLSVDLLSLGHLGSGYPLYFYFLKFSLSMLFMMFISSGVFNLASNLLGSNCLTSSQILQKYSSTLPSLSLTQLVHQHSLCQSSWVTSVSFANKLNSDHLLLLQSIMNFCTVVGIIVALQSFRKEQREAEVECDENNVTAGDYALALKKVRQDQEGLYHQGIMQAIHEEGATVSAISLAYHLTPLLRLHQQMHSLVQQKKKDLLTKSYRVSPMPQIEQHIQQVHTQITLLEEQYRLGRGAFTGVAFVTMATEEQRDTLVQKYGRARKKGQQGLMVMGRAVEVEMACEPTDVFWTNLGVSQREKWGRRGVAVCIDIGVMGGLFAVIVAVLAWQNKVGYEEQGEREVVVLGYVVSVLTVVVNQTMGWVARHTTAMEKWSSHTEHNVRLASKATLVQFLCSAVLQFLTTWLFLQNYVGPGGLIYNQTLVFLSSAVLLPIVLALHPLYQLSRLRIYQLRRHPQPMLSQAELQTAYEWPAFPLTMHYAALLQTVLFCAFYAPLIPLGLPLTMAKVLMMYWLTKYNLLFRSSAKTEQSKRLSVAMTEVIEWVLVVYTASNFLFEQLVAQSFNKVALAALVLGAANAILPMHSLNSWLFPGRPDRNETLNYFQAEQLLKTDYARANPALSSASNRSFIRKYQV